ncbi:MAG: response regulator transcription factor [Oculatellaceae cyanobacterium Prado106]|jgi:DNA-binding NarL/FixJ family response regulator|nr:response regulator transcription factor [Oculatellaceae cyanobacterium Prado106]
MIRLLLVEDQILLRDGLKRLLESKTDLQVVGEAGDGKAAIAQVEALIPDIVLMDVRMPIMDGVTATQQINQQFPAVKVLVLTTFADDEYVGQAMQAGAIGYLLKDTPTEDLAIAIRSAHKGYTQFAPGLFKKVFSHPTAPEPSPKNSMTNLAELTPREREVLSLVATGANNREIAEVLNISEKTVKNHISNILMRLNLRDRTQAAVYAHSFLLQSSNSIHLEG